jgi:hypothetical protein
MKNSIIKLLNISKIVLPIVLLNLFMNGCSEYEPLEEVEDEANCASIYVSLTSSSYAASSGCSDGVIVYVQIVDFNSGAIVAYGDDQYLDDNYQFTFENLTPKKYKVEIYKIHQAQPYFIKNYTVTISESQATECDEVLLFKEITTTDLGC